MRKKWLGGLFVVACGVATLVGVAVLAPRFAVKRGSDNYDELVKAHNKEIDFDNLEPEIVQREIDGRESEEMQ